MRPASPYAIKTTELSRLVVADENSVFEIRTKISRLFTLLGYDSFYTTYISTLFSDICREILFQKTSAIEVGIRSSSKPYFLKFSFFLKPSDNLKRRIKCFFDEVEGSLKSKNGALKVFLNLSQESLSGKTLKKMQDVLSFKSKEELYRELEKTYTQLNASKKMAQLEKMSAVGTLSAGIAHELNNPLMGIINFVQYCIKHTPPEDKRYAILEDAKHEALRCVGLIQNLLSFSRLEEGGPEDFITENLNIVPIVDEALKLLLYRIEKEKVHVVRDKSMHVMASINRNQIKQVLLNILSNGLDAMKISQKKILEIRILKEENTLSVVVTDTGVGISADTLVRVFDPFFTTKPVGQGTGLGLSICQNIIKKHSGEIKVSSEKGKWTAFDIRLPLIRSENA